MRGGGSRRSARRSCSGSDSLPGLRRRQQSLVGAHDEGAATGWRLLPRCSSPPTRVNFVSRKPAVTRRLLSRESRAWVQALAGGGVALACCLGCSDINPPAVGAGGSPSASGGTTATGGAQSASGGSMSAGGAASGGSLSTGGVVGSGGQASGGQGGGGEATGGAAGSGGASGAEAEAVATR